MRPFWLLLAALTPLASAPARAEDGKLDVTFALRSRVEAIDGQFRPAIARDDAVLLLRSELAARYDAGPIVIGGEVIDSRGYFERTRSSISTGEVNALEPVQAFLESDVSDQVRLQAGRFTMALGSGRLIARPSFRNTVNGFTGARLDLSGAERSATFFWTLPQTRLPDDRDSIEDNRVELDRERIGLQFFGGTVNAKHALGGTADVYIYRLAERDAPGIATRDRHLWTLGGHLERAPAVGTIDYEIEAAYQFGDARTGTAADSPRVDVAAWFAHADIGRRFAGSWKPRVQFAADYASGDGPGGDYGRFDTLFGSHTSEFGPSSFYNLVDEANLVSVEARAEIAPTKRVDAQASLRPLWLARATDSFGKSGVRDAAGQSGHYAGTQIEGRVRYWLSPDRLRLTAGAATLFKGRFLRDAPNAPDTGNTHYGYLELALTL